MIELSPKAQFQKLHKEHADKFADAISQPCVRVALTHALAQFSFSNPSAEELVGARHFMEVFANLHESKEPTKMPAKSLMSEAEMQAAIDKENLNKK